jgi:hypothetical protein
MAKKKARIYENGIKIDSIQFDTIDELSDKLKEKDL